MSATANRSGESTPAVAPEDSLHRQLGIALSRVLLADLRRNPPVVPARKRRAKARPSIALVKGGAR